MGVPLVLLRHGQSTWNLANKFTGWTDVDLSEQGVREAHRAGQLMREEGLRFDAAETSLLKRALRTLWIALDEMDLLWIPVNKTWIWNERHYGDLQGKNKLEAVEKHGEAQVHQWRRGYAVQPPPLSRDDERHPCHDPRYADLGDGAPGTESLADTLARVVPYYESEVVPKLRAGKRLIIAAHGNSLRALVKHLDGLSDDEITGLNIPTGYPLVYELDDDLRAVSHRYLGNQDEIAAAADAVAKQSKK